MQYYNAVLRPSESLSAQLIEYADKKFSDVGDGYCLSGKVFPHITLCLFKANEMPDIAFDNIKKSPEPMAYNIRIGKGIHQGYVWAEILIKPEEWLSYLHEYVKNKLNSYDVEILTKNYMPHMTFCRLPEDKINYAQNIELPDVFLTTHSDWKFEVGRSDVNGQYLGL